MDDLSVNSFLKTGQAPLPPPSTTPNEAPQEPPAQGTFTTTPTLVPDTRSHEILAQIRTEELEALLPLNPKIQLGALPNGMTYYVASNHEPKNRAYFRLVLKVGSAVENPEEEGLAHLIEHLVFHGSGEESSSLKELVKSLEEEGCAFGPHQNAFTSSDRVEFDFSVPLDKPGLTQRALRILKGFAFSADLTDEAIHHERQVVLRELQQRDGLHNRYQRETWSETYNGNPLGRPPIGSEEVIKNAKPETIREFYKKWYRPELMAVVAVGDFREQEVLGTIRKTFGDIPASSQKQEVPRFEVNVDQPLKVISFTDEESVLGEVIFRFRSATETGPAKVKDLKQTLVQHFVEGIVNRRFERFQEEGTGPYQGAALISSHPFRGLAVSNLVVMGFTEGLQNAATFVWREVKRLKDHGFLPEELNMAKATWRASHETVMANLEKEKSAVVAADCIGHFVDEDTLASREWLETATLGLMEQITPKDLEEELKDLELDKGGLFSIVLPASHEPIDVDALVTAIREVESGATEPYFLKAVQADWMDTVPEGGEVVSTVRHKVFEAVEMTLSNGVRVTYKPSDLRKNHLQLQALAKGGYANWGEEYATAGLMVDSWVGECGMGGLKLSDLQRLLNGTAISLACGVNPTSRIIKLSGRHEDMTTALKLLRQLFVHRLDDPGAFEKVRREMEEMLKFMEKSPSRAVGKAIVEATKDNHFLARDLDREDVPKVDYEKVREIYNASFLDPSQFHFVVIGDMPEDELKPLLETFLGSIPTSEDKVPPVREDYGLAFPNEARRRVVNIGVSDKGETYLYFPLPEENDRRSRLVARFLQQVVEKRLMERLRFEMGETYTPSVFSSWPYYPIRSYGTLALHYTTDPGRVEELEKVVMEEVAKLRAAPPTEEELSGVREVLKRGIEDQRQNLKTWIAAVNSADLLEWNLEDYYDVDQWIQNVSPQEIHHLAKQTLDLNRYAVIHHLPDFSQ